MLVDFCCGANDFSCLVQKKLDEMGKKCSYKIYDFIQPKNDFNFEKRDWMTVQPRELPSGSQLIMGLSLNPPFGVKAALANKFIDKALEFKPKLIILIVPPETERLDKKKSPYDLIWEDDQFPSGKSFYLPGSVDANNRQMEQWNLKPPVRYLWSRPDWTDKHKEIAQKCGHLLKQRDASFLEVNFHKHFTEDHICSRDNGKPEELGSTVEGHKERESLSSNNGDREVYESLGHWKNEWMDFSRSDEQKFGSKVDEILSEDNMNKGISPASETYKEMPRGSFPRAIDGRSSLDSQLSGLRGMPTHTEYGTTCASNIQSATAYGGIQSSIPDDMARRYHMNNNEPYSSGMHRWSGRLSPGPENGNRRLEEQLSGCVRECPDILHSRSYISEFEVNYGRDSDVRSQVCHYGQQDPGFLTQRSNYLAHHNPGHEKLGSMPGTSYGHLGSAPDLPCNMNTSTMQRHAPRLDELNPTMMSNKVPEQTTMGGRNGIHDHRAPGLSYRSDPMGFASGPQRPDPVGFAPGPQRPDPTGFAPGPQRPDPTGFAPGPQHPDPRRFATGPQRPNPMGIASDPQQHSPELTRLVR